MLSLSNEQLEQSGDLGLLGTARVAAQKSQGARRIYLTKGTHLR